ncbi:sigma-70 family RNA polymerase sigma factor [Thomasclavelia ramosa]|uniref:sigma-70 family RNA polymerase sigma factor n=1 Tax=Thomasclavelia ramosa TaxID=1547 RepID=UPI00191CD5E5|nr:sigma-70 family RNA polymerase sigma factor [Thomasclavelia ramosa]MCR1956321.1 sigma-70 family RNA polymerase sigma factor [Thomasclavelia ramosa]QQV06465.1 sigma-70 family RNA polymerase sigma factor [Thomasclavelia ramosa]
MGFNYANEAKKWNKWKDNEEKILRELEVDEEVIQQLRIYDWNAFKAERRIRSRQNIFTDKFFITIQHFDKKEISNISDLLDEIENEAIFDYLTSSDKLTLTIILLKVKGYSTNEIATILNISCKAIYSRIYRLKKNLKKLIDCEEK